MITQRILKTLAAKKVVRVFLLLFVFCDFANGQAAGQMSDTLKKVSDISTTQIADSTTNNKQQTINRKRLITVSAIGGAAYIGGMTGLYQLWYKDYPSEEFHFFDDSGEWQQMDKCGHVFSAYQIGLWGIDALRWTGIERKKAIWYGAGYAYLFQTTIEVFDGFSSDWGFSPYDMIANTLGSGILVSQELLWDEQRFRIKFSYHASPYADVRPDQLGESPVQRLFKDYNGQTYWLSCNINCWLKKDSKFPPWLNLAFGYGANGMTGASENPDYVNGEPVPHYDRYRQFYFAPDIDLTRIKTKSLVLKRVFNVIGILKVPLPTLEYNSQDKFIFHGLFF
ncbi:MAG: DUF2279 domain-containing protein [Bacteroidia bacterium]